MYRIETMEKCNRFLEKLRLNGWDVWQMQYRWNSDEGFHAWFWKTGEDDIEIVTHNEEVQKTIVGFNGQK
jgi:hypothetical protein